MLDGCEGVIQLNETVCPLGLGPSDTDIKYQYVTKVHGTNVSFDLKTMIEKQSGSLWDC